MSHDPALIDLNGRPHWLFADGSTLPMIRGGIDNGGTSGGDGSGGGDGGSGAGGDGSPGAGDGDPGAGSGEGGSGDTGQAGAGSDTKVEFTPEQKAELGRRIAEERAKAKTAAEAAAKKTIEQAAERAKMDEAERLKAEKTDAETAAKDATEKANRKLVVADAKVAAVGANVPTDRVDAFVKLADLSGVAVDEDGNVDAKALAKAVKKTIDDNPFLKASAGNGSGRSGGDMNGNGGKQRANNLEDAVAARLGG